MSSRIRSAGLWTPGSVVEEPEWELFDENQSQAVDGRGGTYAPSQPITIGESSPGVGGLRVTALFETRGDTIIGENTFDTLTVRAATELAAGFEVTNSPGNFNAGMTVNSGTGQFNGPLVATSTTQLQGSVVLNSTLSVFGTAQFAVLAQFQSGIAMTGGVLGVTGDATIGDNAGHILTVNASTAFNSPVEFRDPVTLADNGHIRKRVIQGADGDATYGINDADHIQAFGLTADRVYTLSTTGAATGSRISFTNETVSWQVTAGGTVLKNATGFATSVTFVFLGGLWRVESVIPHA